MKFKLIINDSITIEKEIDGDFKVLKIETDKSIFEFESPKIVKISNENCDNVEFNSKDLDDLYKDDNFWGDEKPKSKKCRKAASELIDKYRNM